MDKDNKASELRLMLIGMVGDEKTSVMNLLLESSKNQKPAAENIFLPEIEKCQKETITIEGHKLVIVNTPGLCNPEKGDKDVMREVRKGVSEVAPGPHVFLLVLPLGPFTEERQNMVKLFKTSFGESLLKFVMVLFPEGEKLTGEKTIEEFISEHDKLEEFVNDDCERRYHVLHSDDDLPQVTKLVKEIQSMVAKNNGDFYVDAQAQKRRIALSINGAAVAGAGVGGAVSHFVGAPIGLGGGLGVGAVVGGVVGFIGIIAAERNKKQGCVLQ